MKLKKCKKMKTALLAMSMSVMMFATTAHADGSNQDGANYGETTTKEYDRIVEHQSALNGAIQAPKDYTGVGYLLEHIYHVQPELPTYVDIDEYTRLAIGGLETSIIKGTDGHYYMKMEGYYEFNMDCWTVDWNWFKLSGMGKEKDSYTNVKGADGKDYVSDFSNVTTDPVVNSGDIENVYLYSKQETTYTKNNNSTSWEDQYNSKTKTVAVRVGDATKKSDLWKDEPTKGQNYKVSYYGSDGNINFFYSVNGSKTLKKGTIKVPTPQEKNPSGGYILPSEAYTGQFSTLIDLGTDRVSYVRFSTFMGLNSCMYVLSNGQCYSDLIEDVALIEKTVDGNNEIYTVQFDANVAYPGDYTIPIYYTDASGVSQTINHSITLGKGKNTYTFDISVPKNSYCFMLGGVKSNTNYYDNKVRTIKNKIFNIDITALNHSSTSTKYEDVYSGELGLDVELNYNLSTTGTYEFTYSYIANGKDVYTMDTKYVTKTVVFDKKSGTYKTNVKIPVTDAYEVRLANVKSPDGAVKYYNKVIYENHSLEPVKPKYFNASVEVGAVKKYTNAHVMVDILINYAIPDNNTYNLVIETKTKSGGYEYITIPLTGDPGYYTKKFGYGTSSNALSFSPDLIYAKLYHVEKEEFHTPVFGFYNQYIYCDHTYTSDCDVDCNRCGAFRTQLKEHEYSSICDPECNVCHERRQDYEEHKFSHGCTVKCENPGCDFESTTIIHDVKDFCATQCRWCDLQVEPVHYFNNENVCTNCGIVRKVQTGWVYDKGIWSFYNDKGIKQTGWKYIKNCWYYMDQNGIMQTGFKTINGKVYYFDKNSQTEGRMLTGLQIIDGKKYYFNKDGSMGVGWKKLADKWYYFDTNKGAALMNKWIKSSGKYYYFGNDGIMVTNNWSSKDSAGKYYWLNEDGTMAINKWVLWKGKYYYIGNDGSMQKNAWIKDNGKYYWVGSDGAMLCDQWVDNGRYYVNSKGVYEPKKVR